MSRHTGSVATRFQHFENSEFEAWYEITDTADFQMSKLVPRLSPPAHSQTGRQLLRVLSTAHHPRQGTVYLVRTPRILR